MGYVLNIWGDSITFGAGDELKNGGWCGRLKKYFEVKGGNHRVYNLGISGDTSNNILERFDVEAKARVKFIHEIDRQIIIFSVGVNDTVKLLEENKIKTEIDAFKKNISTLIEKAKSYTKEVVFIGMIPVDEDIRLNRKNKELTNERVKQYNNIIKELCNNNTVFFFDIFQEFFKLSYKELLSDGLHPNSEGYEKMYELIKNFLIENKLID
ncbi:MAG: GDSL-type esterase/lipase family protein [Candidatus Paceibacterota bacterium]